MNALWFLLLFPLAGSLICGVLHFRTLATRQLRPDATDETLPSRLAPMVACGAMALAFAVALWGFFRLDPSTPEGRALQTGAWRWMELGNFSVDLRLWLDPLSSTLTLVITGVGLLIHIYSVGYMKGDKGYAKFFAYLNFFVAMMLILVLSKNLLGLFVGWEGVGLASYLLIGFWYEKGWPAEAGQKAFVVNRIGDACFLVGSFLLVRLFGTLDLADIGQAVPALLADASRSSDLALAALLLFGGACGKSAQIPLFTWLPDAMAGPTPVSALIHAATMVTAGVYLIVRLNPVYAAAPSVLFLVGVVGALTAFVGATSALVQKDIKKVLAYSTVSQLGYMFLGLGAGAWASAVFHLVTHAFFKGLLFLGAGSVIHGMHEEQDMTKMGGLKRHMPKTWITFLAGSAALSGLPLMSGFFSKDEILAMNFGGGGFRVLLWGLGVATAAITAFYTWRMVALTFYGKERFDVAKVHPHESPAVMTRPLQILAVLAVLGGLLGLPPVLHLPHALHGWLSSVTALGDQILHGEHAAHLSHTAEWILLGLGSAVALFFAHKGFHAYKDGAALDERFAQRRPELAAFFGKAWAFDQSYVARIVRPVQLAAFTIATVVDQFVIDGAVNGVGTLARQLAARTRRMVDGNLKSYALWMSAGAAVLAFVWIWG